MDVIVRLAEQYVLGPHMYPWLAAKTGMPELLSSTYIPREFLSSFLVLWTGGALLYLFLSSVAYVLFFVILKDKYYPPGSDLPKPGQEVREIKLAMWSAPVMAALTAPIVVLELHGYSKLYDNLNDYPLWYVPVQMALFLLFTDTCIYWIHRLEHDIPFLYKYVHKPHHAWIVPTPFASVAFHPFDGFAQSFPYHVAVFLFPVHKLIYLGLFIFVQIWTVLIHDGVDMHPFSFINGSAHHVHHHKKFIYNYGQFFIFWDYMCGTYMAPGEPAHAKKN